MTEYLKTFLKFDNIICILFSNTHADPMLYGKWSKRRREATQEKDKLKTWNNLRPNMSCLKDLYDVVRPKFRICEFSKAKN